MRYQVEFADKDGKLKLEEFEECHDAGMAFARCQQKHPEGKMIRCTAFGRSYGEGHMTHEAPPVQRDPEKVPGLGAHKPPKPTEKDGTMPFYDEVISDETAP